MADQGGSVDGTIAGLACEGGQVEVSAIRAGEAVGEVAVLSWRTGSDDSVAVVEGKVIKLCFIQGKG